MKEAQQDSQLTLKEYLDKQHNRMYIKISKRDSNEMNVTCETRTNKLNTHLFYFIAIGIEVDFKNVCLSPSQTDCLTPYDRAAKHRSLVDNYLMCMQPNIPHGIW